MEITRRDVVAGVKRPENGCSTILVEFSEKVLDIAGIGDRTYVPERKPSSHAALGKKENIYQACYFLIRKTLLSIW